MTRVRLDFRVNEQLARSLRSQLVLERNYHAQLGLPGLPTMTDVFEQLLQLGLRARMQELRQKPILAK